MVWRPWIKTIGGLCDEPLSVNMIEDRSELPVPITMIKNKKLLKNKAMDESDSKNHNGCFITVLKWYYQSSLFLHLENMVIVSIISYHCIFHPFAVSSMFFNQGESSAITIQIVRFIGLIQSNFALLDLLSIIEHSKSSYLVFVNNTGSLCYILFQIKPILCWDIDYYLVFLALGYICLRNLSLLFLKQSSSK